MESFAGWIAPIATMVAAMLTAANLGARVTGWGFVVFTVGSLAWTTVALASDQTNLLATNVFLTFVNLVGIWRWLGRQRAYEDGARSAEKASRRSSAPNLVTAAGMAGKRVEARSGEVIGKVVDALFERDTGRISYVVVASGHGLEEILKAVPREALDFHSDRLTLKPPVALFEALTPLKDDCWPASAPALAVAA